MVLAIREYLRFFLIAVKKNKEANDVPYFACKLVVRCPGFHSHRAHQIPRKNLAYQESSIRVTRALVKQDRVLVIHLAHGLELGQRDLATSRPRDSLHWLTYDYREVLLTSHVNAK